MKIAFTSCTNLDHFPSQDVWAEIGAAQPDYLFLLGDNIYMDFFPDNGEPERWSDERFEREMRDRYTQQWREPHFAALLAGLRERQGEGGGVYGTWDDHDFAWNNAVGLKVPETKKRITRRLFNEFLHRTDVGAGIEHAVTLRHEGRDVGRAIFLDTRWYRDRAVADDRRPPDDGGASPAIDDRDLLGDTQFGWLARELGHGLPLTVVCAGSPQRSSGGGWALYPRDLRRYRELVAERKVLYLTGDIHEAEFLPPSGGTRHYEIVASGAAVNKRGPLRGRRRNYGLIDWTPERTHVKLVDKRGMVAYTIDNATFEHVEHEPD